MALRLLESSFPRELSRLLDVPVSAVSRALAGLERDAVGRPVSRSRVSTINPRYVAKPELEGYLIRLSEADAELRSRLAHLRRRPRKTGNPL